MRPEIIKVKEYMINLRMAKDDEFIGCTVEEINKLEEFYSVKLPEMYVDFLLTMGHGAGRFWQGDEWTYEFLFELKDDARNCKDDDEPEKELFKSDNVFMFFCHEYLYDFFYISDQSDPNVYRFFPDTDEIVNLGVTFSKYLMDELNETRSLLIKRAAHGLGYWDEE